MGVRAFLDKATDIDAAVAWIAGVRPVPWWGQVLVGVACAIFMVFVRWALDAFYRDVTGFMILLPAVILAGLAAGRVAGLVATLICLFGGWWLVGMHTPGTGLGDHLGKVATVNFVIVGLFSSFVAAALRKTLARLEAEVTARRASEARVDETEDRFRLISEQAPVMLWMSDETGKCIHLNRAQAEFWNAPDDLAAFDFPATIHPEDRERVIADSTVAVVSGKPFEIEARYRRAADGAWRLLRTNAQPRFDRAGRFIGMLGVNSDVTETRAAEAALRESETRFRLMADTAPAPVWLTNAAGEVEFVNAALVEFYGQPAEQILGHVWRQAMHPDDVEQVNAVQAAARPKFRPYGFEARFRRADAAWRWMRIAVKPRIDADGLFMGYVGMSFDITDTRDAIDALARQERRQTFLLDLADRLRDLSSPDDIMEEVERSLGDLLGVERVGYGEVDQARGLVSMSRDWTAGVVSARGQFSLKTFGADLITDLAAGDVIRIPDVREDPRTRDVAEAFAGIQTRALVRAPLIRAGRLRAFLYVHASEPRDWTDAEVQLVEEVSARTWAEVERARAEAEVRESEYRFRNIADTAPVLIWVTQQDRQRAFVNEAYVAFNGGTYEEARTADWRAVLHPDDHERILRESLAGEETGQPFSMEARYLRHDGEYRWLKSFSRPRLGPDNVVLGFVGVAFDVTDIRETTARLAAAAAERDAILGQLGEGVIVTDPAGRITFVNDAAVRIHGVDSLDVPPEAYSETYHLYTEAGLPHPPDDLPLARAVLRNETVTDARWRIRRPDGTEVLAVGNARPVSGPDGESIGAVLTLRDETARVQAEQRLSESEARFRTVADSAPALIWMSDDAAQITFANRRFRTFFGIKSQRQLADGWRRHMHLDDVDVFGQAFMRAFEARDRFEAMARIDHPTLGLRWLRTEGVPRFDATGGFQGYVGASLDVTDGKRAEDDLKRINELLEERVGEALLEKAKAEADLMHAQRMEAVGRLTGGVAHDFNNLLTVVIGALDIILRSDDPATRKKLGEAALSAARRGERLTHQLLAFSRRQALRPEAVDLNGLIREGEPLLRRAVGETVEFKLKLKRGGVRVNVDPAQFEAALLNLIVNARDALGDELGDKGRIVVETSACRVRPGDVVDMAAGDYVCITVSDNGAGMSEEVIRRVFEPFFTTKAVGKGTGLGLSQVYGFARQSGGGVRITSKVGKGSEIRLYLPPLKAGETLTPEPVRRVETAPVGAGRSILLVEDDTAVAAVALDLLEAMGLEVTTAETGAQALELLRKRRFDAMLSDIVMPGGMTGIELARTCAKAYPAMRIVLTSGYVGDDVDQALSDAPWPFVRKPYSAHDIRRALGEEASLPA